MCLSTQNRCKIKFMLRKQLTLAVIVVLVYVTGCTHPSNTPSMNLQTTQTISYSPKLATAEARFIQLSSQNNDIRFQHLSIDQGLSQSSVQCILQDDQGFLWFGTEDGLNRFDGINFTIYRHNPQNPGSLSANTISRLLQDREGFIWVGTIGGGLNRLDRKTESFTHFRHDPQNASSLSANDIHAIFQDQEGRIWIGTPAGLDLWQENSSGFLHFTSDPAIPTSLSSGEVTAIHQDRRGDLWIGTESGLDRYIPDTDQFAHINLEPSTGRAISIQTIIEDPTRGLWLGTNSGVIRFNPETNEIIFYMHNPSDPTSLSDNQAAIVFIDSFNTLWVGSRGKGLDRLDPLTGRFIHYFHDPLDPGSLASNYVSSIYEDISGLLWFGTSGAGVEKYDRRSQLFTNYTSNPGDPSNLSSNSLMGLDVAPDGKIWMATLGGGLNILDPQTGQAQPLRYNADDPSSLSSDEVWDIYVNPLGVIWVGTGNGLDLYNGNGHFAHYTRNPLDANSLSSNTVIVITEDLTGNLWVGTNRGLNRLSIEEEPPYSRITRYFNSPNNPNSLSYDAIWSLLVDHSGTLWIGTRGGGLSRYNPQTNNFTVFRHDPQDLLSLSNNIVPSIFEDRSGVLWVGTYGGGLNRFDRATQTFKAFTEEDGLPNGVIYGILQDEQGFLWLSTNYGISRFDPQAETFLNFTTANGLQSNEYNLNSYCQTADGRIFFGGANGMSSFYPPDLSPNPFIPPVVITEFSLFNQTEHMFLPPGDALQFSYSQNFLSFDFAALDYTAPEKNHYAYQMEGVDKDWVQAGTRRHADYPNLKPGNYTFRVIGSNNDGVWNKTGAAVSITIRPPFWGTPWFHAGLLILIFGIALAAYRIRIHSIEARSQELEQQVSERTRELATLNTIAEVTSSSLDLQETLHSALAKTLEVLDIEAGGIFLLDERDETLKLSLHLGLPEDIIHSIQQLKVGESFSGEVVQTCQPVIVWDISLDQRLVSKESAQHGFRSLASFPIISRARVVGTLFLITRNQRKFTQQNIDMLSAIGRQIGSAIENARFFDAEQHRAEQFRLIVEIGRRINPIMNMNQALEQIARQVQQTFGYYHVGIGLVEADEIVYRVGAGDLWDNVNFRFKPAHLKIGDQGLTGWVAAHGKPLLVPDITKDSRYVLMEGSQARSELVVPIFARGGLDQPEQVIGVLDIQSDQLNDFNEIDQVVLESLAHLAGIAIDNSQRFMAEMRRAEQFRVISEVSQHIASIFSISELLEQLARLIQEGFNYYHVGIGIIEGDEVVSMAEKGACPYPAGLSMNFNQGTWGWVARTGEIALIPDTINDLHYLHHSAAKDVRSVLCVPLSVKDNIIGVISAESDQANFFDQSDVMVLQSLAHLAAVAIENARLFAEAQHGAVIEERSRLARELHDSVTQALYGVTLYAQAINGQLALDNKPRALEHLKELQDTAQEALAEMRLLIYELRPSLLVEEGLAATLQARLMAVEERAGLKTEFKASLPDRLPTALEVGLYRIAQEALNNALKHAHAQKIVVYLHQQEHTVTLEIRDDGLGFDQTAALKRGGMGVPTMRERASELNSRLTIDSRPGAGTCVHVEVQV
jgi:signal transduction histidine kinase/ligand-binding sensor domain-containing protein